MENSNHFAQRNQFVCRSARTGYILAIGACWTISAAQRGGAATNDLLRPFPLPLSARLPYDVDVARVRKLDDSGKVLVAQREFDILAWQAFIALNWPADGTGKPDASKTIADSSSPRIWSFWRPASSIFLPHGEKPQPWQVETVSPENLTLFRSKAAWRQNSTSADQNFQAFSGPLVDQNGNWVRYEVLVNHEEFDYLVENTLYSQDGQVAFSRRNDSNNVCFPVDDTANGRHGAIEIKLAWKEMGPNDDRSRFYVTKVKVGLAEPYKPGDNQQPTRTLDAGLVGMHISMHTRSSPEWVWATFEQIDNVRVNLDAHGRKVRPNFFDPVRLQPVNVLPAKNAILDDAGFPMAVEDSAKAMTWIEHLTRTPVQVKRIEVPAQTGLNDRDAAIAADAHDLNGEVQKLLAQQNSVFQFYELIGTQWPVHPNAPAFAGGNNSAPESIRYKTPGDMVPTFLVNTTMETYFQKGSQPAGPLEQDDRLADDAPPIDNKMVVGTESCVGCHYSAGICIGFRGAGKDRKPIYGENSHFGRSGGANFSWLLQIETQNQKPPDSPATPMSPGRFLDIERLQHQH